MQKEKIRREGQQFSRVAAKSQQAAASAKTKQQQQQGQKASQRATAGQALMARRGIQSNQLVAKMQAHGKEELVKRVMVGVNPQGLSEFHIEFRENVLAGSRLTITAKDGKISAQFATPDANTKRLLKASEGELARAFSRKGLTLERFDV